MNHIDAFNQRVSEFDYIFRFGWNKKIHSFHINIHLHYNHFIRVFYYYKRIKTYQRTPHTTRIASSKSWDARKASFFNKTYFCSERGKKTITLSRGLQTDWFPSTHFSVFHPLRCFGLRSDRVLLFTRRIEDDCMQIKWKCEVGRRFGGWTVEFLYRSHFWKIFFPRHFLGLVLFIMSVFLLLPITYLPFHWCHELRVFIGWFAMSCDWIGWLFCFVCFTLFS